MQNQLFPQYDQGVLNKIREAARKTNTLTITYKDSKGEVTVREGEPYELKDGGLYMYCYERNSIRLFKLDGILKAKVNVGKTFVPKWPIKIV